MAESKREETRLQSELDELTEKHTKETASRVKLEEQFAHLQSKSNEVHSDAAALKSQVEAMTAEREASQRRLKQLEEIESRYDDAVQSADAEHLRASDLSKKLADESKLRAETDAKLKRLNRGIRKTASEDLKQEMVEIQTQRNMFKRKAESLSQAMDKMLRERKRSGKLIPRLHPLPLL